METRWNVDCAHRDLSRLDTGGRQARFATKPARVRSKLSSAATVYLVVTWRFARRGRRLLAKVDRRLLTEMDHEAEVQLVEVPGGGADVNRYLTIVQC